MSLASPPPRPHTAAMDDEAANVYVGGLSASVSPETLRAAFITFGDLVDVHIPVEPSTGASKGFGFVLFEEQADADEAIDNMHNSTIDGARIRVRRAHKRSVVVPGRAVWFNSDGDDGGADGTAGAADAANGDAAPGGG